MLYAVVKTSVYFVEHNLSAVHGRSWRENRHSNDECELASRRIHHLVIRRVELLHIASFALGLLK